jgi:uncharacterized membrane-anchored protein
VPIPLRLLLGLFLLAGFAGTALAQGTVSPFQATREQIDAVRAAIEVSIGPPSRVRLADQATIRLDGALQFIEQAAADRYLRAHNRESPEGLVGLFLYGGREAPWIATIRLVRDGFVDAAAIARWSDDDLLASIRDDIDRDNRDRAARGLPNRVLSGWLSRPRYDPATQSLVWSVQSYVVGVSTVNESDAVMHVVMFGREAQLRIDIIASAETLLQNRTDVLLMTANLNFAEGKRFGDFVPGTDRVAPRGLAGVFDVPALRHKGFIEHYLPGERLVVFILCGLLVLGALIMAMVALAAHRRRNRRI